MEIVEREARSVTFDSVADDYQAARPGYPDETINAIVGIAELDRNSRCLEVGVGTGQATRKLAPYECPITGLEPGENLARVARTSLASFSNVEINVTTFEAFENHSGPYDLLYSATAFHWTDPRTRWKKAAHLIRKGGYIALLTNKSMEAIHETPFYLAARPIYQKRYESGESGSGRASTTLAATQILHRELDEAAEFEICLTEALPWEMNLSSDDLVRLHMTFSDHLRLPEETRHVLHRELKDLADTKFGGEVTKPYETALVIGRRV